MRANFKLRIALTASACAALAGGSLAIAQDPTTEQKLSSARSQADLVTQRIEAGASRLQQLQQQAAEAQARESELNGQLQSSAVRIRELSEQLAQAETRLEAVRARQRRAVGLLEARLVAIYKDSPPDQLSVLVGSEGYGEYQSRSTYLEVLTAADEELAARVTALNEELSKTQGALANLRGQEQAEARALESARNEISALRASAQRRAAEVSAAQAEERAALAQLQQQISGWELEVRKQAAQQVADGGGEEAFLGGPYAIPTYIVMCESGGNYRALNPSSGAGGAYQIIPSTWRAYGGRGLPHQAPKAEQDRIARLIWENDGPNAWSCA